MMLLSENKKQPIFNRFCFHFKPLYVKNCINMTEESKASLLSPSSLIPRRRRRARAAMSKEMLSTLLVLRQWQSDRLKNTHQDLLDSPDFGAACNFFLTDVYAPRDFSQRDEDILYVYHAMKRIMPAPIMRTLNLVISLNDLTTKLDQKLLQVMMEELQVTDQVTVEMYAEGYRLCDNYDERVKQIDLIVALGRSVNKLVRLPLIGFSLRLAHAPAHLSGWAELQGFLERGFAAFKRMKRVEPFLKTIEQREKQILDQIYAGEAEPFKLGNE